MIREALKWQVSDYFSSEHLGRTFYVPPYQRDYAWKNEHWERLLNDILGNDIGYFLGTVICIPKEVSNTAVQYQIVDGQQRMTTLLILYAAIYAILNDQDNRHNIDLSDEDFTVLKGNLRKRLVTKTDPKTFRLIPQVQNGCKRDFEALINYALYNTNIDINYAWNRRIFKAYKYFTTSIIRISDVEKKASVKTAIELIEKLDKLLMVIIIVENAAAAFTLFESLNNTGLPLSIMDIVKNKMLSVYSSNQDLLQEKYSLWQNMQCCVSDSPTAQERFLRHFYHSHRVNLLKVSEKPLPEMAKRSNLINIYELLIDSNSDYCLDQLSEAAKHYSRIVNDDAEKTDGTKCDKALINLNRIGGSPSHQLLLYLFENQLDEDVLTRFVEFLVKFFVRRNLTDTPPTRVLDKLFVDQINSFRNSNNIEAVYLSLEEVSSIDLDFEKSLRSSIYEDNATVCRFILCSIEERYRSPENQINVWGKKNIKYRFEIEHIFPQGEKIPQEWVNMIADGDVDKAEKIRQEFVHTLGNLTLTAFNPELSNLPFLEKKELKDKLGNPIGYLNGLHLNESLKIEDNWTVDKITTRTDILVKEALNLFKFAD